jgi:hypothetical protein
MMVEEGQINSDGEGGFATIQHTRSDSNETTHEGTCEKANAHNLNNETNEVDYEVQVSQFTNELHSCESLLHVSTT